ncbi:MAG: ABC transporter ATP-binding protein [Cyanothece sp. SIO1E1]|nr:ABC transporter ATP-binding protein [Cyanothece sp. SIO1E1]
MNTTPAVTLNQVSKTYKNGTVALKEIDLTVNQGQFISLVGPSGCGKSTLLRLLAGLGQLSSGQIQWRDRQSKRNLAFVFQDPALMPWANVLENVQLPLKLRRQTQGQSKLAVENAIQMVDLKGFEQAYPRQLSGGMQMRVSLARALVTSPDHLLLDEPFGALDEITRSKLNSDLLNLWHRMHWTVVFVTHNIYEAVYLSNRVVVMAPRPGRVIADIAITAPYPRDPRFRTSASFNQYCQAVLTCLSGATA